MSDDWDDSDNDSDAAVQTKAKPAPKARAQVFNDDDDETYLIDIKNKSSDAQDSKSITQTPNKSDKKGKDKSLQKSDKQSKDSSESNDKTVTSGAKSSTSTSNDTTSQEESNAQKARPLLKSSRKKWRPRKHVYKPSEYDYEPNILATAMYPKPGPKESFEEMIGRFCDEKKNSFALTNNNEALRQYGLGIYQYYDFVYENVGDDNHRPFMIDLDCLVLDLLHSPLIDFTHGPQTLPMISLLESRLELFCAGGRSVQIVAFNENRHLWKYAQHLYLREMVLYHLIHHWQFEQNLLHKHAYPLVFEFDSYWCAEFARYCYIYLPVFALVGKPEYSALVVEENNYLQTYLILYLTALDIPCVHTSEVTFASNAMFGFTFDIPRNVRQYIFNSFLDESPVAAPVKLKPLASPQTSTFVNKISKPNDILFGNLTANELIMQKSSFKSNTDVPDKMNLRCCLIVYALIMMFRDKKQMSDEDWDFVRVVLVHIGVMEDVPLKLRSQKLPKLEFESVDADEVEDESDDEATKDEEEDDDDEDDDAELERQQQRAKKQPQFSTLDDNNGDIAEDDDWDDSDEDDAKTGASGASGASGPSQPKTFDDDEDDEPPASEAQEEKNEKGQNDIGPVGILPPTQRRQKAVIDKNLQAVTNQCWWSRISLLKRFEEFCTQCLSVLMFELNASSRTENIDFDALISKFTIGELGSAPIYNPHVDYNPQTAVDAIDGRLICRLLFADSSLLSSREKLGLSDATATRLDSLFALVKGELGADAKASLYPVFQSEEVLDLQQELPPCDKPRIKEDHAFINNKHELVQSLVPDLEQDLARNGLLVEAKKVTGHKEHVKFYRDKNWLRGMTVPDDIPPAKTFDRTQTYEHKKYNKAQQMFTTFMSKYSQSLVGGKIVLRDVIVGKVKDDDKDDNEGKADDASDGSKNQTNAQAGKGRKRQNKKNQQKKGGIVDVRKSAEAEVKRKAREEKIAKVTNLIKLLSTQSDLEGRIKRLDDRLSNLSDPISALPGLEQLHAWCTEAAVKSVPEKDMYPSVRLWQMTFDVFRRFVKPLDPKEAASLKKRRGDAGNQNEEEEVLPEPKFIKGLQLSLHVFGFDRPAKRLAELYVQRCQQCVDEKYLSIRMEDVYVPFKQESVRLSVGNSYERFQLQYCGPYMIRGVGSRPDPRVTKFYPDAWQVRLLDIVDNRYSALIVAPTSSGKTFVSYYAIKDVLQHNAKQKLQKDKGIVVYVAPTKALVWQMCADIFSKYGDVYGVFTGDYDHKALECTVLVCVPETFEHLLMSPQRAEMINRIKYVIFDEVHCLGLSEGGETWERLLMLIRAPFLALSATVGHPSIFYNWLKNVDNILRRRQDKYKHKVRMVIHSERWSDLEKFIYLPDQHIFKTRADAKAGENEDAPEKRQGGIRDTGLYIGKYSESGSEYRDACIKVHPAGAIAMGLGLDKLEEFPPGLAFSPQDSLFLYDAMLKHVTKMPAIYQKRLQCLKPSEFFKNELYINKVASNEYQKRLKQEIRFWSIGLSHKKLDELEAQKEAKEAKEVREVTKTDKYEEDEPLDENSIQLDEADAGTADNSPGKDGTGGAGGPNKKLSKKEQRALEQKAKAEARKKKQEEDRKRREQEKADKKKRKRKGGKGGKDQKEDGTEAKQQDQNGVKTEEQDEKQMDAIALFKLHVSRMLDDPALSEEAVLTQEEKKRRKVIVDAVLNSLAEYPLERLNRMEQKALKENKITDCYSFDFVLDNFTQLLLDLHYSNRLPTLVFCLDRVKCETLFMRALVDLEKLKQNCNEKEKGDAVERARQDKKAKADAKKRIKQIEKQMNNKGADDSALSERDRQELENEMNKLKRLLGEDVDDETDYRFTFTKQGEEMDQVEIDWWMGRLIKKTKWTSAHPLIRALDHGIGLHHEGLPRQYRHLVETMFRYKHIKVIVCVASLAMGINMPARSVVFAGDDPTLNPLNYRQMMGRAGRRGYDAVGYVIFYGIKPRKISYLMTSQLTSLNGHFPITTTYSLRALQLHSGYQNTEGAEPSVRRQYAAWAQDTLKNLFHAPFSGRLISKERLRQQIRHQFRYSLEYQLQLGLITNKTSKLDGLSGLVSYLHSYEPDNFAFAKVLESGLLHKICEGYGELKGEVTSNSKKLVLCKLLLVLCNIFVRHPLPSNYDSDSNQTVQNRISRVSEQNLSPAYLVLPTLDESEDEGLKEVAKVLQQHNVDTLNMFAEYYRIFAETDIAAGSKANTKNGKDANDALLSPRSQAAHGQLAEIDEVTLPQSFIKFEDGKDEKEDSIKSDTLVAELEDKRHRFEARSAFLGLSGLDDSFRFRNELIESLRSDMAVEPNSIPVCEMKDVRGRNLHLNAFVYDFYIHGEYKRVVNENSLRDGQAWQLLKQMQVLLRKVSKSLNFVSNIAADKEEIEAKVAELLKEFDAEWRKMRQAKRGTVFRGSMYKSEYTGKSMTEAEWRKKRAAIKLSTTGDDFVMALKELASDFEDKFKSIVPIGPISNYGK